MMRQARNLLASTAALFALAAGAQSSAPASGAADGMRTGMACQPAYPSASAKARAEGVTKLNLSIDASGVVTAANVVESAGPTPEHKRLDQAIAQILPGCTLWRPKLDANGQGVAYSITLSYRWRLPNADGSPLPQARPARLKTSDGCRPSYPAGAIRARAKGTTQLRMTVDSTGHVKAVEIVRSAGDTPEHKMLDDAAAAALSGCPYVPGTDEDGRPISTLIEISYEWKPVD